MKAGYKNPDDAYNRAFQFSRQPGFHYFNWPATQPRAQHAFITVMTIPRTIGRAAWYEYFPVMENLIVDSPADILMVNIGGSVGHDMTRFEEANPNMQGKLIVQDITLVIAAIAPKSLPHGIEAQLHDFFKTQLIDDSKAYLLSSFLHDWQDKQASIILGRHAQ